MVKADNIRSSINSCLSMGFGFLTALTHRQTDADRRRQTQTDADGRRRTQTDRQTDRQIDTRTM